MLPDIAREYYGPQHDLNCAETMVYAANEAYQLDLCRETFLAAAGFGGGMAIEESCGALTGAVIVLGIMLVRHHAHEDETIKEVVKELFQRYEQRMGSLSCRELKEKYREEEPVKCRQVVVEAANLLQELLEERGIDPVKRHSL